MSSSNTSLKVGVIGPAGFGGSYLCVELINRGNHVYGISRKPEKLGTHALYTPVSLDLTTTSIPEIAKALQGLDVVVNEYGPHSAGHEALRYMPFVEVTRKVVLAVRLAKVGYFIMVGGCGSLDMPGSDRRSVLEDKGFWVSYRRGIADSEAHTSYMEDVLGPMGSGLRKFRNARKAIAAGTANDEMRKVIDDYEAYVTAHDRALEFVTACRTTFMFFDGNESFPWTFVSPPALHRPGKRTGEYQVLFDVLPLKGDNRDPTNLDDRLHGISAADLAIAIADEAVSQEKKWRHWTAFADLSDDRPTPSYVTL